MFPLAHKILLIRKPAIFPTRRFFSLGKPTFKIIEPECGQCAKYKYMDLHCKLAVITGGASGIGLATAHELLKNQLYRVILADCHCDDGKKAVEQLNNQYGKHKACFLQMDVRKHADFEETLEEISKKFGGIDIFINNAGYLDDNYWTDEIDINVKAVIRGCLLGMKYLSQKKSDSDSVIVNVASTLGLDVNPPYLPIFSATQHAIGGLTKSLGEMLAPNLLSADAVLLVNGKKRHAKNKNSLLIIGGKTHTHSHRHFVICDVAKQATVHFKNSRVRVIGICPGPTLTNLIACEENKALIPEWSAETNDVFFRSLQKPEAVARAIIYMLLYAPPGALWVVEKGGLFSTQVPRLSQYRQRVIYV